MADILKYLNGFPGFYDLTGGTNMDASGEKMAMVFRAEASITCDRIAICCSKVGTSPTYRASIQGVSASTGAPDAAIATSGTFTVSSTTNAEKIVTFTGTALTEGNLYAAVIDYSSGTINASNYMLHQPGAGWPTFGFGGLRTASQNTGIPYFLYHNGTSWTKQTTAPNFGYGTSSRMYGSYCGLTAADAVSGANTVANVFTLPSGTCSTYTLAGIEFMGSLTTGGTVDCEIYDAGSGVSVTTTQKVTSHDTDQIGGVADNVHYLPFTGSLPTLTAGTVYRIGIRPSGSATVWKGTFSASYVKEASWGGSVIYSSTRASGNWTDSTLSKYAIRPVFADLTGGGGGGSVILPRAVNGA